MGRSLTALPPAVLPACVLALVLLATVGRYGPHGDELYFRMLPLRWWYEDQPPLTVWITWAASQAGDGWWWQRLPGAAVAVVGCVLATMFPRLLGGGWTAQHLAGWAHAFTVYPLLVGHVFLTASIDLVAWQAVILLVLAATLGRRECLVWAGVVAGAACWNKLLVVVLVVALGLALLLTDRRLACGRHAVAACLAFVAVGGVQVGAQLGNGAPMVEVAADLVGRQGADVRWVIVPLVALFLGPGLVTVWWRGLTGPWTGSDRRGRFLLPAALLVLGWNLLVPAQPYYSIGAFLPGLALGWGRVDLSTRAAVGRAARLVAANSVVATLICLPVLPAVSAWVRTVSWVNPMVGDQLGWPSTVRQIETARHGAHAAITTDYVDAGALTEYRTLHGFREVRSGHNALWRLGPPTAERVLLIGSTAHTHTRFFRSCHPSSPVGVDVPGLARRPTQPTTVCEGPVGGWEMVWPHFRRSGG